MDNLEKVSKHIKISSTAQKEVEQELKEELNDISIDDSNSELDEEAILDAIEKDEEQKENEFDDNDLIQLINIFDTHIINNEELRNIFKNNPEKFMDSEVDLDQDIRKFNILSVYPQFLKTFYDSNALPNLIQLIGHPNIDISTDVIQLFSDLVDLEITEQLYDIVIEFYYKLVENDFFESLVGNFKRFNEKIRDDFNIIHKSLQIIENLLEIIPKFAEEIVNRTQILQWLAKRINNTEGSTDDDNSLYASEILAILLQSNSENQFTFGNIGGIDDILIILSKYRKIDPQSEEEKELIANLYDSLCFCLQVSENQERFRELQGIDLMIRILRANNHCSILAIKVLDYTFQNNPDNCKHFVQQLGLKFLFPFFMKKGKQEKDKEERIRNDEHIISCIQLLLTSVNSVDLERVLNKFRENQNEKIQKIFEIQKYYENMTMQSQLEFEKNIEISNEFEFTQNSKEDLYFHKLKNGLSILQSNSYIIIFLMNLNYPDIKLKIKTLFKQYNLSIKYFQRILHNQLKYLKQDDLVKYKQFINLMLQIAIKIQNLLEESKGKVAKEIDYPIIQEEKIENYAQFEAN